MGRNTAVPKKNASESNKKASSKGSQYTIKLTRKKLFLWSGLILLGMVWMFILGVFVGRGLSPVRFDVKKLEKELIALKQKALKTDQALSKMEKERIPEEPELGFYEILTDKKKEDRSGFAEADRHPSRFVVTPPGAGEGEDKDRKERIPLKLAVVRKSVAKLRAKPPEAPEPRKAEGQGLLTIQVASLNDAQKARQMVDLLSDKGYAVYEVTVNLPGKGTYHRVRVGRFSDSIETSQVAARLKREGFEVLIVRE